MIIPINANWLGMLTKPIKLIRYIKLIIPIKMIEPYNDNAN